MEGKVAAAKQCTDIFDSMEFDKRNNQDSLVREWLSKNRKIDCWISGKYQKQKSAHYRPLKSNDGVQIAEIVDGSSSIDSAIESSAKAQNKWEAVPSQEKSTILYKIKKELNSKSQLFAEICQLSFVKNDFTLFVDYFNFYSEWALLLDEYKNWKPHGVVLLILSSDSSLQSLAACVAPALAAGCSVVVKPAYKSVLSAFLLAEICSQSGLPDGLLNIVPGSKTTAETFITKKGINKVIFQGSHITAESIYLKFPGKSFSYFNQGHTSAIVFESCDTDAAVDTIFSDAWDQTGQNSWAIKTVVVQESISNILKEKLKRKIHEFSTDTDIPLRFHNKAVFQKISKAVANAKTFGASIEAAYISNEIWTPTVIFDYQNKDIDDAPVVSVLTFRTAKEAVQLANSSRYSLGTSVWTEVSAQALEVASKLNSGTVWVNCHGIADVSVPIQPFRSSGDGNFSGRDGALEFVNRRGDDGSESSKPSENKVGNVNKSALFKTVQTSQVALAKWSSERNKRKYLYDVAEMFSLDKELLQLAPIVHFWAAQSGKYNIFTEQNQSKDLVALQNKEPLGVIVVYLNEQIDVIKNFTSLVAPAVGFGNVVVTVTTDETAIAIKSAVNAFSKCLPSNILTVVSGGIAAAKSLASDPNVQAMWLCSESAISAESLLSIKQESSKHLTRLWLTPSVVPRCKNLFWKEALRNKVVWLTRVNQFP